MGAAHKNITNNSSSNLLQEGARRPRLSLFLNVSERDLFRLQTQINISVAEKLFTIKDTTTSV